MEWTLKDKFILRIKRFLEEGKGRVHLCLKKMLEAGNQKLSGLSVTTPSPYTISFIADWLPLFLTWQNMIVNPLILLSHKALRENLTQL